MERAERKKRKMARRASRQRASERAPLRHRSSSFAGIVDAGQASATAVAGFTSSVTGILRNRSGTLARRNTQRSQRSESRAADEEEGGLGSGIELETIRPNRTGTPGASTSSQNGAAPAREGGRVEFSTPPDSRNGNLQQSTNSETSSTSATPSLHRPTTLGQALSWPTTWLQVYLRRLRHAHEDAARKLALEREERRREVFESRREREARREEEGRANAAREGGVTDEGIGWGLGSFGIKEHRESARRLQAARDRLREERLLPPTNETEEGGRGGDGTSPLLSPLNEDSPVITPGEPAEPETPAAEDTTQRQGRRRNDSDWEDVSDDTSSDSSDRTRNRRREERQRRRQEAEGGGGAATPGAGGHNSAAQEAKGGRRNGWSWWGPLKDWRLSDRSTF